MARTKGTYSLSANIETNAAAPLDARTKVNLKSDLTATGSFPYAYEGMPVYVIEEKKIYVLTGNDPTVLANWKEIGSGGGGTDIENPVVYSENEPNFNDYKLGQIVVYTGGDTENFKEGHIYKATSTWSTKTWNGITSFNGEYIWSDEDNIYYSFNSNQYILEKTTSTWIPKTWNGLSSFNSNYVWSDGDNIYYSYNDNHYVLDKATSTWIPKTWDGLSRFNGSLIWSDGDNIYCSNGNNHYVLDKTTSTWTPKTWNGYSNLYGDRVWFDEDNIYYSSVTNQYILDKTTSTWTSKTWDGLSSFNGSNIWSDGNNIYYSFVNNQYVLDKATSTWTPKTWNGLSNISGSRIWSDGDNTYYSNGDNQYVLDKWSDMNPTTVVDEVTDGNMNAVTSNAVADAIDDLDSDLTAALQALQLSKQDALTETQMTAVNSGAMEYTVMPRAVYTQNAETHVVTRVVYSHYESSGGYTDASDKAFFAYFPYGIVTYSNTYWRGQGNTYNHGTLNGQNLSDDGTEIKEGIYLVRPTSGGTFCNLYSMDWLINTYLRDRNVMLAGGINFYLCETLSWTRVKSIRFISGNSLASADGWANPCMFLVYMKNMNARQDSVWTLTGVYNTPGDSESGLKEFDIRAINMSGTGYNTRPYRVQAYGCELMLCYYNGASNPISVYPLGSRACGITVYDDYTSEQLDALTYTQRTTTVPVSGIYFNQIFDEMTGGSQLGNGTNSTHGPILTQEVLLPNCCIDQDTQFFMCNYASGTYKFKTYNAKPLTSTPTTVLGGKHQYIRESANNYHLSSIPVLTNTDAVNYALNKLTTGSDTPQDDDYYISQYSGGGTTTTTYHRRPMSKLWEYIRSKISPTFKHVVTGTGASDSSVDAFILTFANVPTTAMIIACSCQFRKGSGSTLFINVPYVEINASGMGIAAGSYRDVSGNTNVEGRVTWRRNGTNVTCTFSSNGSAIDYNNFAYVTLTYIDF